MKDADLWRQIETAPTALATVEDGLETAIVHKLSRQYQLNPVRCAIVMLEYRRFRYLCEISESELRAPPLIQCVQARDTPYYTADGEANRWKTHPGGDPDWNKRSFHRDPLYQPTLDLYRQEFGFEAPPQIWPSPLFMRRQALAWVSVFAAFGVIGIAAGTGSNWVAGVGIAQFVIAFFYTFRYRHWADPSGD